MCFAVQIASQRAHLAKLAGKRTIRCRNNNWRDACTEWLAVGYLSEHALALIAPQHWLSPVEVLRLITYWLCHGSWAHLMGNLPTLLLLGPGLEARFGTWQLAGTIVASGLVIALVHCLLCPDLGLHGLSGAVFSLLMLAGGSQMRTVVDASGPHVEIPITYLMLACVWIGKEFASVSYGCCSASSRGGPSQSHVGSTTLHNSLPCRV